MRKLKKILLITGLILGIGIFLYPTVSNWVNNLKYMEKVDSYQSEVSKLSKEEIKKSFQEAEDYNNSLKGDPVKDPFVPGSGRSIPNNYNELLNVDNTGVMGTIEIPSIDVNLPIYHGVNEDTLQRGVGHIQQTALPIGGEGNHAVLTGHTGLPEAKLFDDLTEVKKGDMFDIHVMDKTLYYQVDKIQVILPEQTDKIVAYKGKDLVTLITCTPYGVNTHRLLVRGIRTKKVAYSVKVKAGPDINWKLIAICCGIAAGLMLLIVLINAFKMRKLRKKQRKKRKKKKKIIVIFSTLMVLFFTAAAFSAYQWKLEESVEAAEVDPDKFKDVLTEEEIEKWRGTVAKPGKGFIQVKNGMKVDKHNKADITLIDPPYSVYNYNVKLIQKNSSKTVLYSKKGIKPGTVLRKAKLKQDIGKGTNSATLVYEFVDYRGEVQGTHKLDVTLEKK